MILCGDLSSFFNRRAGTIHIPSNIFICVVSETVSYLSRNNSQKVTKIMRMALVELSADGRWKGKGSVWGGGGSESAHLFCWCTKYMGTLCL